MDAPELEELPSIELGTYRHYKGGEYQVNDTGLWVRPYGMFTGEVQVNGRVVPRFALVAAQ